jgi:hypothetical protein
MPPAPNLVGMPKSAAYEIERSFSIVQRKALSPDSFDSLDALADRLLGCGGHDRQIADRSTGPSPAPT